MQIEVVDARSGKPLETLFDVPDGATIFDVKKRFAKQRRRFYPDRQSYKADPRARMLKDSDVLADIGLRSGDKLYFKDLGPQIGWTTVFLTEYAGPLIVYLLFYPRPALIYGAAAAALPRDKVVKLAAVCWTFHYTKRILETLFIHRFSHNTMPIANLFKNSSYYWGFAAFISYYINHPLYTPPMYGDTQIAVGLSAFLLGVLGNFSIHLAFRSMRPAGSKVRKIPEPTSNPFTSLFSLCSCPNYTYEGFAWLGFSLMTQSLPALIFTGAGFYQMTVWALGKHRNYKREFKEYPRSRKAIIPFLL